MRMIDFDNRRVNADHIVSASKWIDKYGMNKTDRQMGHIWIQMSTGSVLHWDFDVVVDYIDDESNAATFDPCQIQYQRIVKEMGDTFEFGGRHIALDHVAWVRFKKRKKNQHRVGSRSVHIHLSNGSKLCSFRKEDVDEMRSIFGPE